VGLSCEIGHARSFKWDHHYGHTSRLVVQVRVLRYGVHLAVQVRYRKVTIEGDNLIIIRTLKGINQVPWQIAVS